MVTWSPELYRLFDVQAGSCTGDLDFLRVAKTTFAQSETSIGELYAWEFDGPATRESSFENSVSIPSSHCS